MNQILFLKKDNNNHIKKLNKSSICFIIIFILCIFLLIIILYKYLYFLHISNNNYKFSESLSDVLRIQSIYDQTHNNPNSIYPIIGYIEISKINLNYPIFSYTNDDLLKIGICKVYGPQINTIGNLCLAGHNFDNDKLFSNLNKLFINDTISIYDNFDNSIVYKIYKKFEVSQNDTSILEQTTELKEITLITCNNKNKKRLVIKAKEIE